MSVAILVICTITLVVCGLTLCLIGSLLTLLDRLVKILKENPLAGLFNNDISGIGSH